MTHLASQQRHFQRIDLPRTRRFISVASLFRGYRLIAMVFDKFWNRTLIDGQTFKMLPVASVTIGFLQMQMNWDDEHDMDGLDLWGKSFVTTFSSGQNGSICDFLGEELLRLLHSESAICTRVYSSIFLQYIEDDWSLLVGCIERGVIPA
jgi:auxin responsive GH3 family protein